MRKAIKDPKVIRGGVGRDVVVAAVEMEATALKVHLAHPPLHPRMQIRNSNS